MSEEQVFDEEGLNYRNGGWFFGVHDGKLYHCDSRAAEYITTARMHTIEYFNAIRLFVIYTHAVINAHYYVHIQLHFDAYIHTYIYIHISASYSPILYIRYSYSTHPLSQ